MLIFYSLVFTLPIPNHPFLAYQVGPFNVTKYLGLACLLAAVFHIVRSGRWPITKSTKAGWLLAYFVVAVVSCIVHDGTASFTLAPFLTTISTFVLFFTTVTMIRSVNHLRWAVLVALAAVAWGSLYVISQWLHFHSIIPGFRTWGGLAGDPNYYAVTVVLWMPLMTFWLMTERPKWEKWFCAGCISVMLVGFIFAASRGGFLGLSVAMAFLIWHTKRRVRTLALAALFMLPILLAPGQSAVSRLMHPDNSDQESTEYRLELWQASERSILENPVFGTGMGHFRPWIIKNGQVINLPFHVAHNTYVGVLTDLGLAGFVPFIIVLIGSMKRLGGVARRMMTHSDPDRQLLRQVALGLQAGLLGYMVCASFLSTLWQQVFWFSVFLSMSIPGIEASLPKLVGSEDAQAQPNRMQVPWKTSAPPKGRRAGTSIPVPVRSSPRTESGDCISASPPYRFRPV